MPLNKGRMIVNQQAFGYTVLGLDCSSSTVGWGIVDEHLNLITYGHFKPLDSKHTEIERLDDVYCSINEICNLFKPNNIAIEDILLFMKGKSKARTTTLLSAINRVAALSTYHYIKKDINFYPVQTIRKLLKKITKQTSGKIDKKEIPNIINDYVYDNFLKEALYKKKRNGELELRDEMFDEADGIAVALAYVLEREI